jgi:protein-disulfide isomerase
MLSEGHDSSVPEYSSRKIFLVMTRMLAPVIFLVALGVATRVCAQAQDTVVASINGQGVTEREVDASVVWQLLPLKQQIYSLRKTALENLITRRILEDAAKQRSISVDELKQQLTAGRVEISSAQVDELFAENATAFAAMSIDEAKERIRLDLETQARMKRYRDAVAELKKQAKIELRMEEPKLPAIADIATAPAVGPLDAAVTVIEFSDFQCPFCRSSQVTLKQILREYKDDVRLVFKHLPLDIHEEAFASAQAAYCAEEQKSFWKYQDALFASDNLSVKTLTRIASDVGLNVPKFNDCLNSEGSRNHILRDIRDARQFGIMSTPTFLVNGKLVSGAVGAEAFKTIIEDELKAAKRSSRSNNGPSLK